MEKERKKQLLDLMSEKFSKKLWYRAIKLTEEVEELKDAVAENTFGAGSKEDIIDELADVYIVTAHITHLLGITEDELFELAEDKIIGRLREPEYKRKHPHQ